MISRASMTKFCSLALLAALLWSVPAMAQDDAKARMQAAEAYEKVQPIADVYRGMIKEMRKNPQLALTEKEIQYMEGMDVAGLRQKALQAMANHFTVAELNAMAAFYSTPEGKSINQKLPAYSIELMPHIQGEVMKVMQKVMADRQAAGQPKP